MKKNNKKILFILIAIVVIIVAAITLIALGSTDDEISAKVTAAQPREILIGLSLMLTGPYSDYGANDKNAIELALDDANKKLLDKGIQIKIIYEDNAGDKLKGVTDTRKFIDIDDVDILVGPDCGSGCTLAAAPVTEKEQRIMMAPAASNPAIGSAGEYVFTLVALDDYEANLMAEYAYNNLSAKKAALVIVQDDYGQGLSDGFEERFKELGGKIVLNEKFPRPTADFRTILTKIEKERPDVVYIIGYEDLILFFKQAHEMGIESTFVSGSMLAIMQDKEALDEAAKGYDLYYASQVLTVGEKLKREYSAKYGKEPDMFSALFYDSVTLLGDAIYKCESAETTCIANYLYSIKDYQGESGAITITEEGWTRREMLIIKN